MAEDKIIHMAIEGAEELVEARLGSMLMPMLLLLMARKTNPNQ